MIDMHGWIMQEKHDDWCTCTRLISNTASVHVSCTFNFPLAESYHITLRLQSSTVTNKLHPFNSYITLILKQKALNFQKSSLRAG